MLQAYLCHENCEENGSVIETAAGWAGKSHLIRSNGSILRANLSEAVTIEKVEENWSKITNMENGRHFQHPREATAALVDALETMREGGKNGGGDDDVTISDYTEKDLILYALGGICYMILKITYNNNYDRFFRDLING